MAAVGQNCSVYEFANLQKKYSHVPWILGEETPLIQKVVSLGTRRTLEAGELLHDIGSIYQNFFIVTEGVLLASSKGSSKKLIPRWIACPGSLIGENALFTQLPAVFRVEAVEKSELSVINRERVVDEILPSMPEFSLSLMESMALKRSTYIVRKKTRGVSERVAQFLQLCSLPILRERASFIELTAHNIATLLGVNKGSVTKAVKAMEKQAIIRVTDNLISLLDSQKLDSLVKSFS